jgi:capsular polysaccharide biosynthesis protein
MTEIREYWRILRARWYIPVVLTVLTIVFTLLTARTPPPTYVATLRFTIGVNADPNVTGQDPILGAYQASEYIRDDFVYVLSSEMFADAVNATLNDPALKISKNNLAGAVEKQRRIMSLTVTWNNPDEAKRIADAAAQTLAAQNAKYFAQLGSQRATVTIIDGPDVAPVTPGLRERLDIFIRAAIAFAAGVVLAFILDYLDDSVRGASDVEKIGLKVMGEIPDQGNKGTGK